GVDAEVAERAIQAVEVFLQPEDPVPEGAGRVEHGVAVLEPAVTERDAHVPLGNDPAVEVRDPPACPPFHSPFLLAWADRGSRKAGRRRVSPSPRSASVAEEERRVNAGAGAVAPGREARPSAMAGGQGAMGGAVPPARGAPTPGAEMGSRGRRADRCWRTRPATGCRTR